jgi:hypothetical protein
MSPAPPPQNRDTSPSAGNGVPTRGSHHVIVPMQLTISLDPTQSTVKLFRPGMAWLAKHLYFEGMPKTPTDLESLLEQYDQQADNVLRSSPLLVDLDLDNEADAGVAVSRIEPDKRDSREWWALFMGAEMLRLKDALELNDARLAAWSAARLVNARAMLIFLQSLEETVWRGYVLQNLGAVLQVWQGNRSNGDERFWQGV